MYGELLDRFEVEHEAPVAAKALNKVQKKEEEAREREREKERERERAAAAAAKAQLIAQGNTALKQLVEEEDAKAKGVPAVSKPAAPPPAMAAAVPRAAAA
eukprot:259439-Chlamydomonas_euryale.AAC.1